MSLFTAFKAFTSRLNAVSPLQPDPQSVDFPNPAPAKYTVRGSIACILDKDQKNQLRAIKRIEVCESEVKNGLNIDKAPSSNAVKELMLVINKNTQIQELSFEECDLKPEHGAIIGGAIVFNKSLRVLHVNSSQLKSLGMKHLLGGLMLNEGITAFRARSYNVVKYYWSAEGMQSIADVVQHNKTLKLIDLPNNQISNDSHEVGIPTLANVYLQINDRVPATVKMNFDTGPVTFNQENAKNGSLKELAEIKFWSPSYKSKI